MAPKYCQKRKLQRKANKNNQSVSMPVIQVAFYRK